MDERHRLFDGICRLCLRKSNLSTIFSEMPADDNVMDIISKFANIQLFIDDGLPQRVCYTCLNYLKVALNFRNMCRENDTRLRKVLTRLRRIQEIEGDIFRKHFPIEDEIDTSPFNNLKNESDDNLDDIWEDDTSIRSAGDSDTHSRTALIINKQDPVIYEAAMFQKYFPKINEKSSPDKKWAPAPVGYDGRGRPKTKRKEDTHIVDLQMTGKEKRTMKSLCKWAPAPPGYDRRGRPKTKRKEDADGADLRMTKKEKRNARKLAVQAIKLKRKCEKSQKTERKSARYLDALDGAYTPNGPVNCKICGKRLSNVQSLRLHAQVHFGFSFICELCGKGCRSYASLDQHFMIRHGRERRLSCQQCDYRAINRAEMRVHERTHTGERPYQCDQCGISFHRRLCLVMHIKRHSTKMYKCDRCPKSYVQNSSLKSHVNNVHDRQFVFKCHLCEQTYTRTISVRKHLEEKHAVPRDKQGQIRKITVL